MEELKPFPFCGREAVLNIIPPHKHFLKNFPDYPGATFIECLECSCGISRQKKKEAIKAWNKRHSS